MNCLRITLLLAAVPRVALAGFHLIDPAETGIHFANRLSPEAAAQNQILLNGSGAAAGDVDADGLVDLYFCAIQGSNRLYRNLGAWRFEEVAARAGVDCSGQFSTGAAFADLDGDADLDLLVNSISHGTRAFFNDGKGTFAEKTPADFRSNLGAMSMALADIDHDGDLDLYVANYRASTIRSTGFPMINVNGRRVLPPEYRDRLQITPEGKILEAGEPDGLFLNDGRGNFVRGPWNQHFLDGEGPPREWGLSVLFRDVNDDTWPDLYVCNDFHTPDRFWINDGSGRFRPSPSTVMRSAPTFSMCGDFADVDRNGKDDFFAADMLEPERHRRLAQLLGEDVKVIGWGGNRAQVERNVMQQQTTDGFFADLAFYAGVEAAGWAWSTAFVDVDLDGFEDLLVTCGNMFGLQDRDANELIERKGPYSRDMIPKKLLMYPPLPQPNLAFHNMGGRRFSPIGCEWGFNQRGVSHGMCLADLDNDGDLDVAVNNMNAPAGIYRNEASAARVGVRLRGEGGNTRGIGAKIKVLGGAVSAQSQEMIVGGRYLSSDDPMRVFAADSETDQMRIEVTWPSGRITKVEKVQANRVYEIAEASAVPALPKGLGQPKPLFTDVSELIGHSHIENTFDDFARQALLPNRLSQLGPGISWADINDDGKEDLIIGSGRGGKLAIFESRGANFARMDVEPSVTRDQATILVHGRTILAGASNYEDGLTNGASVRLFSAGAGTDAIPAQPSSTGPMALGDIDGDGQLELFVGGRVIPARYPEPASSTICHLRDGKWAPRETLSGVGLVSGALFTDLTGDGLPELVLACEWGPVKIFANDKGKLHDATSAWGMDQRIGWWNGVASGDFDSDGRMDLAVSNWGLNTKYRVSNGRGPRVYYANWGGAGQVELIEASFDSKLNDWAAERDLNSVGRAIPFIRERFRLHREYANATIEQILGDRFKEAHWLEVNWLETSVFLNRGGGFELGLLPIEAQFTPAFGVNVADFDGDGHEDIFLSQNFFAVQPQTSRNDAGRGLLLRGKGKGDFEAVDGARSGIRVYGEQRGSAVCDYDADGRVDLVISQNGAATKLFRNLEAVPGVRIRLRGSAGNPRGIGAILRIGNGPAREIHAGSGYWSQDSAVQVLARPKEASDLQVRWPGGRTTKTPLAPGQQEITVTLD